MLTLSISVNFFIPSWSICVFTTYSSSLPPRQSLCVDPSPTFPQHSLRGLDIGRNLRGDSYGNTNLGVYTVLTFFFNGDWKHKCQPSRVQQEQEVRREFSVRSLRCSQRQITRPLCMSINLLRSIHHSPNRHSFGTDSGHATCLVLGMQTNQIQPLLCRHLQNWLGREMLVHS